MLISLPLLLASATLLSGGDSIKKKSVVPTPPPTTKSAPSRAKAPYLGSAIGKTISSTISGMTPRATYLSTAIKARVAGGPPVPARFHASAAATPIVADSIVVEKARRTLTLYLRGTPVRLYFVALGANPVGSKTGQGDGRTPEGVYHIEAHNPDSKYHLSLKVSYPNSADIAAARSRGVSTGGDIMIHGLPDRFAEYGAAHRQWDWTKGCIAVTNQEIEEIWSAVADGATIQIKP